MDSLERWTDLFPEVCWICSETDLSKERQVLRLESSAHFRTFEGYFFSFWDAFGFMGLPG